MSADFDCSGEVDVRDGSGEPVSLTYDRNASQWTAPLNFIVGRTIQLGDRPWKISAELNYYVTQSDAFGPRWMIDFNVAPVVKNALADFFWGAGKDRKFERVVALRRS